MSLRYVLKDQYWKMRISHPYSMMAYCDDLAVTCGQAPIGDFGEVLHPGDLCQQSDQVIEIADRIISDATLVRDDLERIVVFTSEPDHDIRLQSLNRFRAQGPESSTVYLVPLPPLFYDDLLVEVDYYGIPARGAGQGIQTFMIQIDIDPDSNTFEQRLVDVVENSLDQRLSAIGLDRSSVVKLSCYAPNRKLSFWESLSACRITWFPENIPAMSDVVSAVVSGTNQMTMDFTCIMDLAGWPVKTIGNFVERGHPEAIRCGPMLFTSSLFSQSSGGAPAPSVNTEVNSIMQRHKELLADQGMTFSNVLKATTFYEGAGSPEALHENMSARNAYYSEPGPGSTGLPVSGFPYKNKRTSIELIAVAST